MFFKTAWGSFRRQVRPIIRALKLRQEKLTHERLQTHAIYDGVRDLREHADDQFKGLLEHTDDEFKKLKADLEQIRDILASESLRIQTSSQDQDMKDLLEEKLNVPRSGSHNRLESPGLSSPSAGNWIFIDPRFRSWEGLGQASSRSNVLFLNGSPGAGLFRISLTP